MLGDGQYSQIQAPIRQVHNNLDQEIIQITEDKLRLVLNTHIEQLKERQGWIAPLGLFLAILTTLVTSTFRDFGLKAATWEAIFWIVGIFSFLWLLKAARQALQVPTIDDVVEKIKNKSA
ncbi:hypothetical protein [Synechococcus elongatus]|uniref:hypothetical protein n=1 Tax=Synechococcus elongatus TaxID=32046 RepID=UPI000F7EB612|nr:hypothetical protein [Synechococcus elongatus]